MSELQKDLLDIATGNLCAWVVEKEGLSIKEAMRVIYSSKLYDKLQDPETGLQGGDALLGGIQYFQGRRIRQELLAVQHRPEVQRPGGAHQAVEGAGPVRGLHRAGPYFLHYLFTHERGPVERYDPQAARLLEMVPEVGKELPLP